MAAQAHKSIRLAASVAVLLLAAGNSATAVDGVVELNQACAVNGGCLEGDEPGFPITIVGAGSYRLTSSLESLNADSVISDGSSNGSSVHIDLNGFTVRNFHSGDSTSCSGIKLNFLSTTVVVNGMVQGANGCSLAANGAGVEVGPASAIRDVVVAGFRDGIEVGSHSLVKGCIVRGNNRFGIIASGGSLVVSNVVRANGAYGLSLNIMSTQRGLSASGYKDNILTDNGGAVWGGIELGKNVCDDKKC